MFKKINKNAIKEAVNSDDALISQLEECRRYRRAFGFYSIILILVFGLIFLLGDGLDVKDSLIFMVLLVSVFSSASSNNSRCDLLEAIATMRDLNVNLPSPPERKDASVTGRGRR